MRVLLDEHVPVQVIEPLRHLLAGHDVDHVYQVRWGGKKDRNLIPDAARKGYQVIVTNDRRQLFEPDELKAIKRSRMHHVRYLQRGNRLAGLGLTMGALIAALPLVMEALAEANGQRLVDIKGLSGTRSDRFGIVDPAVNPPAYWPRRTSTPRKRSS